MSQSAIKGGEEHVLSIAKRLELDAQECLRLNEIDIGTIEMAPKHGETHRGNLSLTTNLHGMAMNSQVCVYRYDVSVRGYIAKRDNMLSSIELTKKCSGDALTIDRRNCCRDLFMALKNKEPFLRDARCVYYDLQSILFSLDMLQNDDGGVLTIQKDHIPEKWNHFVRCEIQIRKVREGFELQLGDLSGLDQNLDQVGHSLEQFLNIVTSQYAMFNPEEHVTFNSNMSYMMNNNQYGFIDADGDFFDDTQSYLAIGADKAVRFIEGPTARGAVASVLVQTKKTAFHNVQSLIEKASALVPRISDVNENDRVKLEKFLAGLFVQAKHSAKFQRFRIDAISKTSARNQMFDTGEGGSLSVEQYFLQAYKKELEFPNAPLVVTGFEDNVRYFPMEVCNVCDNQRVKIEQQTPAMVQKIIKKCAILPSVLMRQNESTGDSLHLWDDNNRYLSSADIRVLQRPMDVMASSIESPKLQFGRNQQSIVRPDFTWQTPSQYIFPSACKVWGAYAFLDDREKRFFNEIDFNNFVQRFVEECRKRGMSISEPAEVATFSANHKSIEDSFKNAAVGDCEFLFIVHSDVGDVHAEIKAAERAHSVLTQTTCLKTMNNVVKNNRWQTLQNIVNKANIKLGGLNYSLALTGKGAIDVLNNDTLFIGFSSNHPGGGMGQEREISKSKSKVYPTPTVIGFSANIGINGAFDFVGDFVFQEQLRNEKVDVIAKVVGNCLQLFEQCRKKMPTRVVVYRDGCGEGQFKMVLKYEVPLIKLAFRSAGCSAALTIIVVNKLQNVRFFDSSRINAARALDQNIRPGTVIDHTVVHPVFSEFFLNSHRALQGTARTPKYTVLLDESKMKLSQLESMAYHLCYGHQIVFLPTSFPSPVFIAKRFAERGRMLYKKWM